jgi:hypothetical protein
MTERSDGGLDVPVAPVRPPTNSRLSRFGLVAGVIIGGALIGLAVLPSERRPAPLGSPAGAATPATTAAAASAAPTSRRREAFLAIPNLTLAGAPTSVFARRIGDDAVLFAWTAGDEALRPLRTFPGAFSGIDHDPPFILIAPDGRSLLLVEAFAGKGRDNARLVTAEGGIAWEDNGVTGIGAVWSADSRVVTVASVDGFSIITIDALGKGARRDVTIDVGAAPVAPVGYSEDGRWIYGASFDVVHRSLQPAVRVALDDGRVERISDVDSTGPDRLDARAGGILDAATGRTVSYGANAAIPGGPPTIEVKEPDGTLAYRVTGGVTLGTLWTADGRLVVFDADGVPFPSRMRLRVVAADGTIEATPLDTGPVAGGGLIGAADGFVSLAFTTDRPDKALQLVVVRLDDGASSALVVPLDDEILGSGILR